MNGVDSVACYFFFIISVVQGDRRPGGLGERYCIPECDATSRNSRAGGGVHSTEPARTCNWQQALSRVT